MLVISVPLMCLVNVLVTVSGPVWCVVMGLVVVYVLRMTVPLDGLLMVLVMTVSEGEVMTLVGID